MSERALVLFSGGQDSTVCLAWALDRFDEVETVGFDYRQRHRAELVCRHKIRESIVDLFPQWSTKLGDDHMLDLGVLNEVSETALTRNAEIAFRKDGLPTTFVPGRNLLFFTLASAVAHRRGLKHLVGGMCETDYSGYPDCRDDTLKALQVTLNLGMNERFVLHTPLMWTDKAATWSLAEQIGGQPLLDIIVEDSHTCYVGDRDHRHPWGYGCGECPACKLRAQGHEQFAMINESKSVTPAG